jgi:MFS superfamily sulfate permease-like transporter
MTELAAAVAFHRSFGHPLIGLSGLIVAAGVVVATVVVVATGVIITSEVTTVITTVIATVITAFVVTVIIGVEACLVTAVGSSLRSQHLALVHGEVRRDSLLITTVESALSRERLGRVDRSIVSSQVSHACLGLKSIGVLMTICP